MALTHDLRRRLFACFYDRILARHEERVRGRKQELLGDLAGTVLEIGPGTGANLAYLQRGVRWVGVEPNPYMHPFIQARADKLGIPVEIRRLRAEEIDLPENSVDAVIATLVLCSVTNPPQVLREIRKVLRPGGRFVFLDHVAARKGSAMRLTQRIFRPLWRFLGDGCTIDREIEPLLHQAGFTDLKLETFRLPCSVAWMLAPHLAGVAYK